MKTPLCKNRSFLFFPLRSLASSPPHFHLLHPLRLQIISSEAKNVGLVYTTHNGVNRAQASCMEVVFFGFGRGFWATDRKAGLNSFRKGSLVIFKMSARFLNTYLMSSSFLPPTPDKVHKCRTKNTVKEIVQSIQTS